MATLSARATDGVAQATVTMAPPMSARQRLDKRAIASSTTVTRRAAAALDLRPAFAYLRCLALPCPALPCLARVTPVWGTAARRTVADGEGDRPLQRV